MIQRSNLGEFEELVLLVVAILHENAYGISVLQEIERQTDRAIHISAVHAALDRLEQKGFLTSNMGGATSERGGRRKRLFTITAAGVRILDDIREMRNTLFDQIPKVITDLRFS